MTYLPAVVTGRWYHLYLILDLYSRKIVGWEVHDSDQANLVINRRHHDHSRPRFSSRSA